jgi:hypothetical protein
MVEAIILGLVDPLNQHLVKLVGFEFPADLHRHFRKEASSWLNKIQRLRMKPTSRSNFISTTCLITLLVGKVQTMRAMMEFISSDYDGIQATKSPEEVVAWLKEFTPSWRSGCMTAKPCSTWCPNRGGSAV